jgi:hypothetical protein
LSEAGSKNGKSGGTHRRGVSALIEALVRSFGILLTSQLLDLPSLLLDLALLLLKVGLGLIVLHLLILHMVADRVAADRANTAANRRSCPRMSNCRADYRSSTCAHHGADTRALFAIAERFARTSAKE